MIRLALLLAVLLLAASPAQAKEIARVSVCGVSDCVRVTQKDMPNETLHLLAESIGEADPPTAPAPWYRVEVRGRGEGETFGWSVAYVPSEGLVRGLENAAQTWSAILPDAEPVFRRLTRGLDPKPAATLEGLDVAPSVAQVDEVFAPAPAPDAAATWPWLVAAAAGAVAAVAIRRRRAHVPTV